VSGKQPSVNGIKLNQDRFGIAKSAVSFDGTQSALWIPSDNAFNTQHTTISMWVRVNEILFREKCSSFLMGDGRKDTRFHSQSWQTGLDDQYLQWYCRCRCSDDNHEMKPGIWQHWVFVQDGTKDLIYLDGQLANSKDAPAILIIRQLLSDLDITLLIMPTFSMAL
jgi:hypothetical protein